MKGQANKRPASLDNHNRLFNTSFPSEPDSKSDRPITVSAFAGSPPSQISTQKIAKAATSIKTIQQKMDHNAKTQSPGIRALDILCSKDKSLSTHPGNRLFRQTIEEAIPHYAEALDKATKMKITKNIVECLLNEHGCRFVKFNADSASWVELSRIESRDKVGHALRFAIKGSNGKQSSRRRSSTAKKAAKRKSSSASSKRGSTRSSVASQASHASAPPATSPRRRSSKRISSVVAATTEDDVETARQNLDQIFERQQEILKALHMLPSPSDEDTETEEDACVAPSSPEVVSLEPLDLDCAYGHSPADFFSAGDLDFLTDESERHQETGAGGDDDDLWDFVDGVVSL